MRRLAVFCGGFAAGIFAAQYLLAVDWLLPVGLACIGAGVLTLLLPAPQRKRAVLCLVGAALALGWDWLYIRQVSAPMEALAATRQTLTMTLTDYPTETRFGAKVTVRAEGLPGKLVYYGDSPLLQLCPGQRMTEDVYLQSASRIRDDDVTVFNSKGVFLMAYSRGTPRFSAGSQSSPRWWPVRLGHAMQARIRTLFDGDDAGFLLALLTGQKGGLSAQADVDLSEAGVYHILAVSGMHCAYLLALVAFLTGRHRRRLTAAVAIPVLRPIFKYCMCFGGAIVAAYLVYANFGLNRRFVGLPEAFVLMLLMSAGAAVGYFMAKMIMEKTLHVFSTGWRWLGICVGIIAVFIFTWEFDLYGYERYVPAQEDVSSVTLSVDYMTPDAFTEQQNIADVRELHRRIINEKRSYEKRNYERYDGVWLMLNYELKDGSTTQRSYYLLNTAAEAEDKNSEIWLGQNIVNSSEAIKARTATPQAVTPETVYQAYIGFYNPEIASYGSTVDLTPEQASELYDSCIQPEIDEGRLGKVWLIPELDRQYLVSVNIGLLIPEEQLTDDVGYWPVQWINLDLSADSPLTNAWIREHFPNVIWATYAETDFGYY